MHTRDIKRITRVEPERCEECDLSTDVEEPDELGREAWEENDCDQLRVVWLFFAENQKIINRARGFDVKNGPAAPPAYS